MTGNRTSSLQTQRLLLRPRPDDEITTHAVAAEDRFAPARVPGWLYFDFIQNEIAIGGGGLLFQKDREPELGCQIDEAHRGQGFAFEGLSKIVSIGFKEFCVNAIIALVAMDHVASRKLCLRLGFRDSGTTETTYSKRRAGLVDYVVFRLSALDYVAS